MRFIGDQPASCVVSERLIDKDGIRTEGTVTLRSPGDSFCCSVVGLFESFSCGMQFPL